MKPLLACLPLLMICLKAQAEDVNTKVLALFEKQCADCHREGDEDPPLHGGVNLTQMRGAEDDLKNIVDRITRPDETKGRMPKSKGKPGDPAYLPPLSAEEISLIKSWAAGEPTPTTTTSAPPPTPATPSPAQPVTPEKPKEPAPVVAEAAAAAPPRAFIPISEEVRRIADDLEKQTPSAQPFLRYLTLTNLANLRDSKGQPVEDEKQLATYRAAISKLLNSLSHEGQIRVPTAIDAEKTIYRFDLRDYGWTQQEWEQFVVPGYPYALRGFDARREQFIAETAHSRSAWVRADWFTFAASQPPLYNQLLRLPDNDRDLEKELHVDVPENLRNKRALRAGFRESGVSQGNRMIERHELGAYPGAYWKSYDFSPLQRHGQHDLFRSPLGPKGAGLTNNEDREFAHDGGEIIWNLRNGLQAYYLSTASGTKLDRAPTEIVQDRKRRDGAIINGISCMACHEAGMKYTLDKPLAEFRDDVGVIALKAGLDRSEQHMVKDLYASQEKLHEVVKLDEERFKKALEAAMPGYDQPLDPVIRLYNRFKADVRLETLAAEFGEQYPRFLDHLKDTRNPDLENIAVQLEAGMGFPRASFLDQFEVITHALRYQQLPYTAMDYTEFTSGAAKAGRNEGQVALGEGGKLTISTDKAHYVKGDLLTVKLKATEGVFVRLYHFSADRKLTQIFPNAGQTNNFVKGGKQITLPGPGDTFRFRMGEPFGTEIILAVASPVQFTDEENRRFANGEVFKQFPEADLRAATRRGLKGLTVEVENATGQVLRERSIPTFTARAVFTIGDR